MTSTRPQLFARLLTVVDRANDPMVHDDPPHHAGSGGARLRALDDATTLQQTAVLFPADIMAVRGSIVDWEPR
ncbi:hypothetical protein ABZ865_39745 [Streptomyces sp. NPDC047085]|uniref:hypothetical protein n=1 Tax=Streptomyces sp. NPDC047085 TaxID=3155140 RepID=UPI0033EAE050